MQVNYYAMLREITGGKSHSYELASGTTLAQLIAVIVTRHPGLRPALLDENGRLFEHVQVFINGRDVPYLEDKLEQALQAEDMISIFPAVGGG